MGHSGGIPARTPNPEKARNSGRPAPRQQLSPCAVSTCRAMLPETARRGHSQTPRPSTRLPDQLPERRPSAAAQREPRASGFASAASESSTRNASAFEPNAASGLASGSSSGTRTRRDCCEASSRIFFQRSARLGAATNSAFSLRAAASGTIRVTPEFRSLFQRPFKRIEFHHRQQQRAIKRRLMRRQFFHQRKLDRHRGPPSQPGPATPARHRSARTTAPAAHGARGPGGARPRLPSARAAPQIVPQRIGVACRAYLATNRQPSESVICDLRWLGRGRSQDRPLHPAKKNAQVELPTPQKRRQAAALHRGDTCHESRSNGSRREDEYPSYR